METFTSQGHSRRRTRYWTLVALATLILVGCHRAVGTANAALDHGAAADAQSAVNGTPIKLATAWVAAVQSKDPARLRALMHPRVLACRNSANSAYFDYLLSNELRDIPGSDYNITELMLEGEPLATGLPEKMFSYPVAPTAQFKIDWTDSQYSSITLMRTIAEDGGRWYIVYPCPNAEGMKYFNEQMAQRAAAEAHAKTLAAALKPSLRAELIDLLTHGHKIDAVKKYRAASGTDLTTAVEVINLLQKESRAGAR